MTKPTIHHPTMILMLGYPGAGKTHTARQLGEFLSIPRVSADRIRFDLFDNPQYTKQEDIIVYRIFEYVVEEMIAAGQSVICDGDYSLRKSRRLKYEQARKNGMKTLTIWVQTDLDTSFERASKRDGRRIDDKYSASIDEATFRTLITKLKRPEKENFVVVSGKHHFKIQRDTVVRKLQKLGIASSSDRVIPRAPIKTDSFPKKVVPELPRSKQPLHIDLARKIKPKQ